MFITTKKIIAINYVIAIVDASYCNKIWGNRLDNKKFHCNKL